jgi:hypothetical protein
MAKGNRARQGAPRPAAATAAIPGAGYIRVAFVDNLNTTKKALTRLAAWAP